MMLKMGEVYIFTDFDGLDQNNIGVMTFLIAAKRS